MVIIAEPFFMVENDLSVEKLRLGAHSNVLKEISM